MVINSYSRILAGMSPNGGLHIGHYHGALKSWIKHQYEHDCYFMVADIHALSTNYDKTKELSVYIHDMVINWLACGIDPTQAVIFLQSEVVAHSQLHLLLSMITPLSWLERVPTYKEKLDKFKAKDLSSYGFLGYPLLQSADILLYKPKLIPINEDQVSHIELAREIARRFNYIYGREDGFAQKAHEAMRKLGPKKAALYEELLTKYQQEGDDEALEKARFLLVDAINLSSGEEARLFAFLEDKSRVILVEPQALVSKSMKIPGLDGHKMSKTRGNAIMLREDLPMIDKKIKSMQTDPARIRRTDAGDPDKCPVWTLHQVYSTEDVCSWVSSGCRTARIGCIECKAPLIDAIDKEQAVLRERAKPYLEDRNIIRNILADGAEKASYIANNTLAEVKHAMSLDILL